ncbi:MAG: PmeII family type II restriction endonuclease [bacterium]|nr:PmeII family type II restriction endonuclease [bacterium]
MDKISLDELQQFIAEKVIVPFNKKRVSKLNELSLSYILRRKNPYLFKAKNIETSEELVKYVLDAYLSSQEETIFGNLMEELAIFVCQKVFNGYKAEKGKFKSVDLIFMRDEKTYIVGIKSGVYWGNKDQISEMKNNFKKAKRILMNEGISNKVIAVNGCMYGKDNKPHKVDRRDNEKSYYKYCGQEFWELVTDDSIFYQKIIIPLDKEAKKRDESFTKSYVAKVNEMTKEFSDQYLGSDGLIDWPKIIDYVSKKFLQKRDKLF